MGLQLAFFCLMFYALIVIMLVIAMKLSLGILVEAQKVLLILGIFLLISSLVFSPLLEYQKTFMIAVFLTEFLKC